MAQILDAFPEITRASEGCPDPTRTYALLRAAREFCSETRLLRRNVSLTLNTTDQYYHLPSPNPIEEVFAIKHASIVQLPTPNNSTYPLQIMYSEYINPNIGQGMPRGIVFVPYTKVAFDRVPDQNYPVTVEVLTQPILTGNALPDELLVRYNRAIGYGALEFLYRMVGSSWANPEMAERYRVLFSQEIVKGRREEMMDFSPGAHARVNPSFRASGRRWGGWY